MIDYNSFHRLSGKKEQSKKKIPVDGYEADFENNEKILPLVPKKQRKSKQVNVTPNNKPVIQVNRVKRTITLSVIQEEEINLFSESSEWGHLSGFEDMITDSSDNDLVATDI